MPLNLLRQLGNQISNKALVWINVHQTATLVFTKEKSLSLTNEAMADQWGENGGLKISGASSGLFENLSTAN